MKTSKPWFNKWMNKEISLCILRFVVDEGNLELKGFTNNL
jgi:hypothetical protein